MYIQLYMQYRRQICSLTLSRSLKVSSTSFTKAPQDSSALIKDRWSSSVKDPSPNVKIEEEEEEDDDDEEEDEDEDDI